MRHLIPFVLTALTAGLVGQQPTEEVAPGSGKAGQGAPDTVSIDCTAVAAPFGVSQTSTTGSNQVLGIANVFDLGDPAAGRPRVTKWFFSDRAGAAGGGGLSSQVVLVYDADDRNYPIASSARSVAQPPNTTTSSWGMRDGEGYSYVDLVAGAIPKHIAMFGDEGDQLHVMDAQTEMWVSTFNHMSTTISTSRAIAIRRDEQAAPGVPFNTESIIVYVSDFSSGFEAYRLNLSAPSMAPTPFPALNLSSPGGTYGASIVDRGMDIAGNRLWYLAVHHQAANTCPGTGRVKLSVFDISVDGTGAPAANYGTLVWERSLDTNITGGGTNTAGGVAGGLQFTTVNNQPCFAGLQQSAFPGDATGFVGLSVVQGLPGNGPDPLYGVNPGQQDCGPEWLLVTGDTNSELDLRFLNRNSSLVYAIALGFPPATGLPLPLNPACTFDLPGVAAFFLILPGGDFPQISIPGGSNIQLLADGGSIVPTTLAVQSTNSLLISVCDPSPF